MPKELKVRMVFMRNKFWIRKFSYTIAQIEWMLKEFQDKGSNCKSLSLTS